MTLSPWLVTTIEACIAASCSAVTVFIVAFCLAITIAVWKHGKEDS